jgi:hypothetical protein
MPNSLDFTPPSPPFSGAYRVIPHQLLAGCHPCFHPHYPCDILLARLVDAGIRSFIDLTEADEPIPGRRQLADYSETIENLAASMELQLRHYRAGIVDHYIPSRSGMVRTLDVIDASLEQEMPVYVHCMAGIGRTGTVIGCYLVRRGYAGDGEEALAFIEKLRNGKGFLGIASPETPEQRDMVRSWKQGE